MLALACPRCTSPIAPSMRFCPQCGTRSPVEPTAPPPDEPPAVPLTLCEIPLRAGGYPVGRCRRRVLGIIPIGCNAPVSAFWGHCPRCGRAIPSAGGGLRAGTRVSAGTYTCFQCSSQWRSRVRLDQAGPLPVCGSCGIHARWSRGK